MVRNVLSIVLGIALSVTACASEAAGAKGPAGEVHGKPSAPVELTAAVTASTAKLTLRFGAPATDVSVRVWGVDGLKLTSAERPVSASTVSAGQMLTLDVAFEAPAGQSNLAVQVAGRFGSQVSSKTVSFTVAAAAAGQAQKSRADIDVDAAGEKVHVVPMEVK